MKFKIHTTPEEKLVELSKIKGYMEIVLFLLTAIEILCEFFATKYFDYVILSLSFLECGLFIYGYLLIIRTHRRNELFAPKYDLLAEFHNTFMTSIIVPMIFVFSDSNTSFENTRISNVDLLKKISIVLVLLAIFYFKVTQRAVKRSAESGVTEDKIPVHNRRTLLYFYSGFFLDIVAMLSLFMLFFGLLYKDERTATFSALFAILILFNFIVLLRIEEKKHIFKIIFLAITVLYILLGIYDIYIEKSTRPYTLKAADYSYFHEYEDGQTLNQYCRFEEGENGKTILKYAMIYNDSEGVEHTGCSVYELTAIRPSKGIFRWYDTAANVVIGRNEVSEQETPVVISVTREATESTEDFPLMKYLENENYVYEGEDKDEREWLIDGDGYILFRNTRLEKTDSLPDAAEKLFEDTSLK